MILSQLVSVLSLVDIGPPADTLGDTVAGYGAVVLLIGLVVWNSVKGADGSAELHDHQENEPADRSAGSPSTG